MMALPNELIGEYLRAINTDIDRTFSVMQDIIKSVRKTLLQQKVKLKTPVCLHVHFKRPVMEYIAHEFFDRMLPQNRGVNRDGQEITPIVNLRGLYVHESFPAEYETNDFQLMVFADANIP